MCLGPIFQQYRSWVYKMWSGDETTQYLTLFLGHSQIVSHSCGDQSGSGLGTKLLGTLCTFEVIVKWKQVYWTQFSNLMWCHWCAIFEFSETSYTGHMILYHIDWGACHLSVCSDYCCVLGLHTARTNLHGNVHSVNTNAKQVIPFMVNFALWWYWF